jgi:hypothetical protein
MKKIFSEMNRISLKEEIKAKQISRDRGIKEGDCNTSYFHTTNNKRRRKILFHTVQGPNGPVTN